QTHRAGTIIDVIDTKYARRVAVERVTDGRRADTAKIAVNACLTRVGVGWAEEGGNPRVDNSRILRGAQGLAKVTAIDAEVSCVVERPLLDVGQEQGLSTPSRPLRETTWRIAGGVPCHRCGDADRH